MMRKQKLTGLFLIIFLTLLSSAWAYESSPQGIAQLVDIKPFTKTELSDIRWRYSEFRKNKQLFSKSQFAIINEQKLAPIIADLILHKSIKLPNAKTLLDFSQQIKDSELTLKELTPRIERYLDEDELIFPALEKAIQRTHFHNFKMRKNTTVREKNDEFVQKLAHLGLKPEDQDKVLNAYAVCIDSFRDEDDRARFMKPNICEPWDEYEKPRHSLKKVTVRETPSEDETPRTRAYRSLIEEAAMVAKTEALNTFEKIFMAKCIAEQSLKFFSPARHPFRALKKVLDMDRKSTDEAFFMTTGVCGNFAGIAYNVTKALGLDGRVYMAQNGLHVYVEFYDDKTWYHAHPFNSKSQCDAFRFESVK